MSKEYIEREAAKRALRIWITGCVLNGDNESADRFRDCIDILDSLDTADVAPVRYGRWRYFPSVQRGELGKYQCSECKHFVKNGSDRNYCPNCGAVMLKQEGKQ